MYGGRLIPPALLGTPSPLPCAFCPTTVVWYGIDRHGTAAGKVEPMIATVLMGTCMSPATDHIFRSPVSHRRRPQCGGRSHCTLHKMVWILAVIGPGESKGQGSPGRGGWSLSCLRPAAPIQANRVEEQCFLPVHFATGRDQQTRSAEPTDRFW